MAFHDSTTDDDYVAQLLAKEAKEASKKYSELGVRGLLPTRPTTAAPKPNTRFLKNIIRETDSHNVALKRKEESDARVRLRAVNQGGAVTWDRHGHEDDRPRKRRIEKDSGDRDHGLRRKRRSRERHENSAQKSRSSDAEDERRPRRRRRLIDRDGDLEDENRIARRQHENTHRNSHQDRLSNKVHERAEDKERDNTHRRKRRRRVTSRDSSVSDQYKHHLDRRKRRSHQSDNSKSTHRENPSGMSPTHSRTDIKTTTTARDGTSPAATSGSDSDSDSDPLEALVGPLPAGNFNSTNDPPPLRSRGRGAYKPGASAMDHHFSAAYNPSLDRHPDSELDEEKEDWDMALEALRDREIWKQKGAERLRAAGFGDEEIKKWEDSGKEKEPEDVKWTAKGEAREWDRGKVAEEIAERKSEVGLEAAWKRKGGGFLKDFKKALG